MMYYRLVSILVVITAIITLVILRHLHSHSRLASSSKNVQQHTDAGRFSSPLSSRFERPCSTAAIAETWPYCDNSLSDEERIISLLDTLTPEEKISMLGNSVPEIPRLSMPPYNWWSEALHGVASSCCPGTKFKSTSFPQVCSLGPSFNRTLFAEVGDAIGTEAVEHFYRLGDAPGLTFWTPNVNIFRDPRWGRGQEVPGEDPYLNGEYAAALIPALQYGKDGPATPRIAAACKHFAAYSVEAGRMAFDAKVDERDLNETYLPAFKKCVESNALGFMCSYNAVNGVPSCASDALLTKLLREEWGFNGYVTGDCGAVGNIYASHKYTESVEAGIGAALKAGVDTDCGGTIQKHGMDALLMNNSTILSIDDVDRALKNLLSVQFRLGYYNNKNPSSTMPEDEEAVVEEEQRLRRLEDDDDDDHVRFHNELALEASRQGVVLLKNRKKGGDDDDDYFDGYPLPLDANLHRKIALFGPNADAAAAMLGNYFGIPPLIVSPKQGLEDMNVDLTYMKGCNITDEGNDDDKALPDSDKICEAASASDASVLVMGINNGVESEGRDRTSLSLPGTNQDKLIRLVKSCAKKKTKSTPVILIIMSGGPLDIGAYKDDDGIDSILYVGYPGQAGGTAIAEALFGKFNPSGRLTTTIYPESFANRVNMKDMRMRPSDDGFPGRTHRYYTGDDVIYPFGYGMSYSRFTTTMMVVDGGLEEEEDGLLFPKKQKQQIRVRVRNEGPMDGSISILLFHSGPNAGRDGNPIQSLVGFEKVFLRVGEESSNNNDDAVVFSLENNDVLKEKGVHSFFLMGATNNRVDEEIVRFSVQ